MRSRFGLVALVAGACAVGVTGVSVRAGTGQGSPNARPEADRAATRLVAVTAAMADGRTTVILKGNGRLVPRAVEEARDLPPRVVVDFPEVHAGVPAVTPVESDSLTRVRVATNSVSPLVTRVVLDLKHRVTYRVERQDNAFVLVLGEAASAAATNVADEPEPVAERAEAPAPASAAPPAAVPEGAPPAAGVPAALATSAPSDTPAPPAPGPAPAPAAATQAPSTPPPATTVPAVQTARGAVAGDPGQERQFTGHPISLDFQGVDLRAVLRTFSEITGLNVVIDPSVQGTVDVALRDVPWDQALDTILRANQLSYTVEGSIVRVAPVSKLREEQEEKRKLADAKALSGELQMQTRTLSYAKAEEMVPLLTRAGLTPRGTIQVDKRTNTLIIRDLPGGLEAVNALIGTLDKAQPQVEIEARIVQTNRNFLRELGFRWGMSFEASQRLGNPTNLVYPNQIVGGGASNLGTLNSPTSLLGIATSSINGAFNLDVELQAAERAGKVRILSTPRVSTQNNVEADISQGTQIPVQTVANNTVTVQFKDATLTLRVRPQITSSNTVIMNVFVENGSPDYTRSVNGIPPIDTQRANTQVQVNDGATTVIGGIFVSTERDVQDRIPGIHRLPLLGWLFKNDNRSDNSQELLIFLTPRIIKG
jgi:type IV pilus assembly protein PilQ